MDIKAVFLSVGRGRLVHTIKGKGIDGDLVRWTASFLSDRTVEMVIQGNIMKRRPVETGIPQGSSVSPILFAIYTSGLTTWLQQRVSGIEGLSFLDDVGWMATSADFSQVNRKLDSCASESIDWAGKRGARIRQRKNRASYLSTHTRPQEAPSPKANNNDSSWEQLFQIAQRSDEMAGSLDGHSPDHPSITIDA